jgi:hypothetical protein
MVCPFIYNYSEQVFMNPHKNRHCEPTSTFEPGNSKYTCTCTMK